MSKTSYSIAHFENQILRSKLAYVSKSSVGFGVCRQFQMLMEVKIPAIIECFTDEATAIKWLTEKQLEQKNASQ